MISRTDIFQVTLVGAILGIAILYFALPRGAGVTEAVAGDRLVRQVVSGAYVSRDDMESLARGRERALTWVSDPAMSLQLSEIYRRLWKDASADRVRIEAERTRTATIGDLMHRPMMSRAWWRLALADTVLAGRPTDDSRAALLMSVRMQPNAMSLVPVRLRLILEHWGTLSPADREMLRPQFAEAVRRDVDLVAEFAANPVYRAVIRGVLSAHPRLLGIFERHYGWFVRKRAKG